MPQHDAQVPDRNHARSLAGRPRGRRLPVDALRPAGAERRGLDLALRSPLVPGPRPGGDDDTRGDRRARRRRDPLLHHPRGAAGGRPEGAGPRDGGGTAGARGSLRPPDQLRDRGHRGGRVRHGPAAYSARARGRGDHAAMHRVRPGGPSGGPCRGIRQGRRVQVHPAPALPAGSHARPARVHGRAGLPGVPPPLSFGSSRPPRPYTAGMPRLAALALASLVALSGCSLITLDLQPKIRPLEEETVEGKGTSKIRLLARSGMLAEAVATFSIGAPPPKVPLLARVREELRKAEDDERVKALIVRINSPGGTITASDILYHELLAFKTRKKVPVIAAIMDVGASGGYYAALAADTIVVNPTTITGSIGVVMITVNAQGLLEKIRAAPLAIKSGPMKDAGSPFRSLTHPERAVFQGIIDEMYGRFVSLIALSRKMPEDRVRGFADGRVYTADQALRMGLVDRIGYLEDVVALAKERAGLDQAKGIMYHRPKENRAHVYSLTPTPSTAESTLAQFAPALAGGGPRFLYLWWP